MIPITEQLLNSLFDNAIASGCMSSQSCDSIRSWTSTGTLLVELFHLLNANYYNYYYVENGEMDICFLVKIIRLYFTESINDLEAIRRAIGENNSGEIRLLGHRWVGRSSQMGFYKMTESGRLLKESICHPRQVVIMMENSLEEAKRCFYPILSGTDEAIIS
jgi:hypothetical protein